MGITQLTVTAVGGDAGNFRVSMHLLVNSSHAGSCNITYIRDNFPGVHGIS